MEGREVVVVEATRSPIGRGHPEKGALRDVHPSTLLATILSSLVERAGIDPDDIEEEDLSPAPVATGKPVLRDPVLGRAIDLLKGLALMQKNKAP